MAAPPFHFEEQQRQTYTHSIRLWIFGADVTPYLASGVTVRKADRDGINSLSFSLHNAYRCFEMTSDNLAGKFRLADPNSPDGKYSETPKHSIYQNKTRLNVTHAVSSFGPIQGGGANGLGVTGAVIRKASRNSSQISSTTTDRYPFTVGSLVFHKYDPVRLFVLNPLQRGTNQWYYEFTGYLDVKPYSTNYVNGESIINIQCQDIRALMKGMRVQANPAAQIGNENAAQFRNGTIPDRPDAGFFNDLITSNPNSQNTTHILGGQNFVESMKLLHFGSTQGTGGNKGAVGKLTLGETVRFDPASSKRYEALEDWNNLVLFGTNRTFLSESDMIKVGQGTYSGGAYSPDNAKVHFLLPKAGSPPSNLVDYNTVDSQIQAKIEWTDRLELINKVVKSIDYQYYVSGTGDVIIEFPMYDFLPSDYNSAYNLLYTFGMHLTNDDINDEGGNPISALEVSSTTINRELVASVQSPSGGINSLPINPIRTIYSNVLASRIGVHMETHHVPGVTNQDRLQQLGFIEFNKRVADFDKMAPSVAYRPFLSVNRPIYNQVKERMGIIQVATNFYNIKEEVTTTIDLSFVRKKEKDGNFRFITGGEAVPISYSVIYDKVALLGQGVNASGPVGSKSTVATGSGSKPEANTN